MGRRPGLTPAPRVGVHVAGSCPHLDAELTVPLGDLRHLLLQQLAGALAALQGRVHLVQLRLQQAQAPLLQAALLPQLLVLPGVLVHLDLQVLGDERPWPEPFFHGQGLPRPEGAMTFLARAQRGAGVRVGRWRPQGKRVQSAALPWGVQGLVDAGPRCLEDLSSLVSMRSRIS